MLTRHYVYLPYTFTLTWFTVSKLSGARATDEQRVANRVARRRGSLRTPLPYT